MMIPLCVKANVATQKFRIPFKNMNASSDTEIDFTFVKLSTQSAKAKSVKEDDSES
jgi:hypothetical protein